jgi:sortase B
MAKHYKDRSNISLKEKMKSIILIFIVLIFVSLMLICSIKILKWYQNNKENVKISVELSKAVTVDETNEDKDKYSVNFEILKEKNADTVAWLKVNNTNIEYTVVKSSDNEYYLNHNFNKTYNSAGWIFSDYNNKFDGTDKNIVIYGHNMRDGSMFGSLKKTLKEEWYNNKENYKITFITENEKATYEIFSIYQIEKEDYYIKTNFKNEEEYTKFLKTIKSRSIKNFNTEVTSQDNILTLSTCANNNKYRVVLHARKE